MHARCTAMRRRRIASQPTTSSTAQVALSAALSAGSAATSALNGRPGSCASSSTATTPTMASDSTPMIDSATRSPMGWMIRRDGASLYMEVRGDGMKTYLLVFASVFLAELGDKTQLATLTFAATPGASRLGVFLAAAAALVTSSLLAVLVGERLGAWIAPHHLTPAAGVVFVAIGLWMLLMRA